MLKCIALAETGERRLKNKDGSERRLRWQTCLFEQGPERRKFRRELGEMEAPMAEGEAFVLIPDFSVNQYGDLEITRRYRIERQSKPQAKAA